MTSRLTSASQAISYPVVGLALSAFGWLVTSTTLTQDRGLTEARFLSAHVALVLAAFTLSLCAVAFAPPAARVARLVLLSSLVPTFALLGLPYGLRALAASTLLVPATLALVFVWRVATQPEPELPVESTQSARLIDAAILASCTGLTFLLNPLALVTGTTSDQAQLAAIALTIGIGVAWLRRSWGPQALVAGAAVVLLAGPSWFAGLALAATAAIEAALDSVEGSFAGNDSAQPHRYFKPLLAAALLVAACAMSWAGLFLFMAAWARRARRGWLAVVVVLGALLALSFPSAPWRDVAGQLLFLPLLFPFAVVTMLRGEAAHQWLRLRLESEHLWRLLTGLALAAVTLRTVPGGLALVATAILWCAPWKRGKTSVAEATTATGIAAWLAAVALGAGYPWLRSPAFWEQVDDVRHIAGTPTNTIVLLCSLVALFVAVAILRKPEPSSRRQLSGFHQLIFGGSLGLSIALVLVGVAPRAIDTVHRWPPTVLTADQPTGTYPIENGSADDLALDVWVDSFLANAAQLDAGTEVARIYFASQPELSVSLLAGVHTGEWSSSPLNDRSQLLRRSRKQPESPQAFAHWWTDGENPQLGQRFRARLDLSSSLTSSAIEALGPEQAIRIDRSPSLPPEVQLRIDRVALASSLGHEQ